MSNIKEEPEEEPTGKKSKRGRRRFREISRINMTVRLLNGDKIHVEKMVRELKYKDPISPPSQPPSVITSTSE